MVEVTAFDCAQCGKRCVPGENGVGIRATKFCKQRCKKAWHRCHDSGTSSPALRTHCLRGHEFTPENTITHGGKRKCRTCHRVRHRERSRERRWSDPEYRERENQRERERCSDPEVRERNRERNREYHAAHPEVAERYRRTPKYRESYRRRNRERADRNRQIVVRAKGDHRCQDCGEEFVSSKLHLHHRDPSTKVERVSKMVTYATEAALRAEITKCDILCEPCHWAAHRRMKLAHEDAK
jgi:hypothetical protein